eukprot:1318358-Amphidinium_carterae.1
MLAQTLAGDRLEVKPALGKGLGVFAVEALHANRFLGCYGGVLCDEADVAQSESAYLFSIGSMKCLDAENPDSEYVNWTRYMNHSACRPTVRAVVRHGPATSHTVLVGDDGWQEVQVPNGPRVEFWTLRKVEGGEELTFNYGEDYAKALKLRLEQSGEEMVD